MSGELALGKLDGHLRALVDDAARQQDTVAVVIRIDLRAEGATPADKARDFEVRTRPLVARLRGLGAEVGKLLWIANSISARLPVSVLCRVAAEREVGQVISDHPRRAL
jgi:hypothetical protein